MTFGTVAILGPGLIGGSLALALAERGLAKRLVIYAREEDSFAAIKEKLPQAELTTDVIKAVREADIVVLCVPIETMAPLVKKFADHLKPDALVTDVGSVKESVDRDIAPLLSGKALWVGSHPMAGSEKSGFSAARADLFVGATVIITPTGQTALAAKEKVEKFWKELVLGGRVVAHSTKIHDISVAQTSHLPHLLAAFLVNHLEFAAKEELLELSKMLELVGGGFRDTTRIASGSPELWAEILSDNAKAVAHALTLFIKNLENLKMNLENPNSKNDLKQCLKQILKKAQDIRSKIPEGHSKLS